MRKLLLTNKHFMVDVSIHNMMHGVNTSGEGCYASGQGCTLSMGEYEWFDKREEAVYREDYLQVYDLKGVKEGGQIERMTQPTGDLLTLAEKFWKEFHETRHFIQNEFFSDLRVEIKRISHFMVYNIDNQTDSLIAWFYPKMTDETKLSELIKAVVSSSDQEIFSVGKFVYSKMQNPSNNCKICL